MMTTSNDLYKTALIKTFKYYLVFKENILPVTDIKVYIHSIKTLLMYLAKTILAAFILVISAFPALSQDRFNGNQTEIDNQFSASDLLLSSIVTLPIAPLTSCAGAAINVSFTIDDVANAGNVFTAQLSDASGSFSSPVDIGSVTGINGGTISATIPSGTLAGNGYRIRVVSSSPAITGTDNGAGIAISTGLPAASTIFANGNQLLCSSGGFVELTGNNSGGVWNTGSTGVNLIVTQVGTYFVTNTNGCGSVQSNNLLVESYTPQAATISADGSTNLCGSGSVFLVAIGASRGIWYRNGSQITNDGALSILVTTPGDYYFVRYDLNLCAAPNSNTITITSTPLPTVSFTGLAPNYAVSASPVTLTGSPAGGFFSGTGVTGNVFDPAAAGIGGPYSILYYYVDPNGCSNFTTQSTTVTAVACNFPPIPGLISTVGGSAKVCPGDIKTYSINPVPGALFYNWYEPQGSVIISGQGTNVVMISYQPGFVGDSLKVSAINNCGEGPTRGLKINRNVAPSTPAAISGATLAVCNGTGLPYSTTPIAGLTYNWSWNVPGANIVTGQGTSSVTVDYNSTFVTGKISVTATNSCGTSTPRNLIVNAKPPAPGSITGTALACAGDLNVPYSISPVPNVNTYNWFAPSGSTISDGTTTSIGSSLTTSANSVTVNFGVNAGPIRVRAVNACAVGPLASLLVTYPPTCRFSQQGKGYMENLVTVGLNGKVFPNPSNGDFSLNIPGANGMTAITITNELGVKVYETRQPVNGGLIRVNLSGKINSGIYQVRYLINGRSGVQKMVVLK